MPARRPFHDERTPSVGRTAKESPQERVLRIYAFRWRMQLMMLIPLAVAFPVFSLLMKHDWDTFLGYPASVCLTVSLIVLLGVIVFSFCNWRCPECSRHLGNKWHPRTCRHCGATLRPEGSTPHPGIIGRCFRKRLAPWQLWGLAAGGALSRAGGEDLGRLRSNCGARACRAGLKEWWGIENSEDLLRTRQWLWNAGHSAAFRAFRETLQARGDDMPGLNDTPDSPQLRLVRQVDDVAAKHDLLGWDLSRLINVARWGYTAGYIKEDTAWEWILLAARRLQRTFDSWRALGDNCGLGYRYWQGGGQLPPDWAEALRWLMGSPDSPWDTLDWNLDLGAARLAGAGEPVRSH